MSESTWPQESKVNKIHLIWRKNALINWWSTLRYCQGWAKMTSLAIFWLLWNFRTCSFCPALDIGGTKAKWNNTLKLGRLMNLGGRGENCQCYRTCVKGRLSSSGACPSVARLASVRPSACGLPFPLPSTASVCPSSHHVVAAPKESMENGWRKLLKHVADMILISTRIFREKHIFTAWGLYRSVKKAKDRFRDPVL